MNVTYAFPREKGDMYLGHLLYDLAKASLSRRVGSWARTDGSVGAGSKRTQACQRGMARQLRVDRTPHTLTGQPSNPCWPLATAEWRLGWPRSCAPTAPPPWRSHLATCAPSVCCSTFAQVGFW